jgi:hypothetical protein
MYLTLGQVGAWNEGWSGCGMVGVEGLWGGVGGGVRACRQLGGRGR